MANYLAQVPLLTNEEHYKNDNSEKVSLMTIHSAKGLEFEAVFIVGLEEDLFPNLLAIYNPVEIEEERRLFYVALTRAKSYCYLSHAQNRRKYGITTPSNPSPFLKEIDSRYTDAPSDNFKKSQTTAQPISPFSQPLRPLKRRRLHHHTPQCLGNAPADIHAWPQHRPMPPIRRYRKVAVYA